MAMQYTVEDFLGFVDKFMVSDRKSRSRVIAYLKVIDVGCRSVEATQQTLDDNSCQDSDSDFYMPLSQGD